MNLVKKYNKAVPRYTSYPAYPHWDNPPSYKQWLEELHSHKKLNVDLYMHIPYCQSLCTYCGCTRTISRDLNKGMDYTSLLLDEWELYQNELPQLVIDSFHLGGGTPTFLKPEYLKVLLENLSSRFSPHVVGAVEIDPRVTNDFHINVLKDFGVNRFSLGIQDFDSKVQKACNRIQPVSMVEKVVKKLRSTGMAEINFDLIYGLPLQNKRSIQETIRNVKSLCPDTIALYGYAHVPWRSKAQKSLERYSIPHGEEKRALYEISKELLYDAGYREIGLDHFALESNELYRAYKDKSLKRTFMGYTSKSAPVTLGLGASAISSTERFFVQNEKDIDLYAENLKKGFYPIHHGHQLSLKDQECAKVIQNIMCQGNADFSTLLECHSQKENMKILEALSEMQEDGLLILENESLVVTEKGKPFLRNICLPFDHRKDSGNGKFSSSI